MRRSVSGTELPCRFWERDICIADLGNFMVLKISPGGVLTMVAGNGTKGYSGNGVRRPARRFPLADGAVDANGNVFIVDGSRIRKVNTME